MARIVRFHKTGGPEVLQIENVAVPPPGKGQVQIPTKARGRNRAESMFRSGQYLEAPKLPARLGYEAAGTVAAVGPGVEGFKVGDAVSTIPAFSLNQYGLYGDLANAPVHAVTHHPRRYRSPRRRRSGCSTSPPTARSLTSPGWERVTLSSSRRLPAASDWPQSRSRTASARSRWP